MTRPEIVCLKTVDYTRMAFIRIDTHLSHYSLWYCIYKRIDQHACYDVNA